MLAKSAARLPGAAALPGGTRYEPKMDGFRVAATLDEETVTLWSRQGKNLTRAFPEIAEALAEQVPPGYVLDGEVVRWDAAGRSSFDALQRRLVAGRRINQLVAEEPASFVVFDMLALAGIDIREQPYDTRRQLLERLAQAWAAPLSLIAMTDDPATAGEWAVELAPNGVEGIVAKGGTQPYRPGSAAGSNTRPALPGSSSPAPSPGRSPSQVTSSSAPGRTVSSASLGVPHRSVGRPRDR
ncbi:hypothetical protein ACRAWC_01770 [Leifsonia sp. L25]|uniref:ATP-dependent DNA ligase n=1 Tax=Leifsonia sp. L25 TaxID=3423957 RepID=UPI003D6876B5